MSGEIKYPDWLIDRVAAALYGSQAESVEWANSWDDLAEWAKADYRKDATAVLDALNFRKTFALGHLVGGRYLTQSGDRKSDPKWYAKWEAQTEWVEVTD